MTDNSDEKYPIERYRYFQCIGKLLPHRIGQILQKLGFRSEIAKGQSNDVDLKVFNDQNQLMFVAEILNWSSHSELPEKRKNWIIGNLQSYDCKKLLIYTTLKNEHVLKDLANYEISLLRIGFQLLPMYFYNHFAKKNQTEFREIDSKMTSEQIKSRLMQYLQSFFTTPPVPTIRLQLQIYE